MKIDPIKLARQQKFLDLWVQNGAVGTLVAVTGFGKSYCAVMAIQQMNGKYPDRNGAIVVPNLYLKSQWEQRIAEHNIKNVKVYVVNTYINMDHNEIDFLILDEIHRYAADTFRRVFEISKYYFVMGLTATIKRQDGKHEILQAYCPVLDTVTMAEARKMGFISDFIVYNLAVELDEKTREKYDKAESTFQNTFAKFGGDFKLAMEAVKSTNFCRNLSFQMGWSEVLGEAHFWSPASISKYAQQFQWALHARKKILHSADTKLDAVVSIINKFPNRQVITFSENTDFADRITARLPKISRAYHTKLESQVRTELRGKKYKEIMYGPKKLCAEAMKLFNRKASRIRVLNTAKALEEGVDIKEIDMAIIASGSSVDRQNIQRMGRALRFEEGKTAYIVNVYVPNSQDEKWMRSRLDGTVNMVYINSIDQIGMSLSEIEVERFKVNVDKVKLI